MYVKRIWRYTRLQACLSWQSLKINVIKVNVIPYNIQKIKINEEDVW